MALLARHTPLCLYLLGRPRYGSTYYLLGTHAELEQQLTKQGLQEIMRDVFERTGDSYATRASNPGLAEA